MGGLGTEGSALILGFTRGSSNALRPIGDYESHESIRLFSMFTPEAGHPSCRPILVADPAHRQEARHQSSSRL